jgi:hypothetical protein
MTSDAQEHLTTLRDMIRQIQNGSERSHLSYEVLYRCRRPLTRGRAPLRGCRAGGPAQSHRMASQRARVCRKAYKLVFHNQGKALYEGAVRRTMRQPPMHSLARAMQA